MATAFVNGFVFQGDGRVMEKATVLVEGERIAKIGKGSMEIPMGAERLSLEGRTLFPGSIDAHVHLCLDGSPDPIGKLALEPVPATAIRASQLARETLMAGFL